MHPKLAVAQKGIFDPRTEVLLFRTDVSYADKPAIYATYMKVCFSTETPKDALFYGVDSSWRSTHATLPSAQFTDDRCVRPSASLSITPPT